MSYSRINYLKKVKLVCELYNKHKVQDVPSSITFRDYIEPVHPMHIKTFYKFLGINYERELKKLEQKKQPQMETV
ncbi:hypothetical protein ACFOWM_06190 [Ferruginibacter yonginensis]|uniref:Uncharacterized protein n=1 Tax=Ferruginibacter yonginensis TaxID=1310416 RepID=A0ABV8QQI4_9BACT